MAEIVWSTEALERLALIYEYIAQFVPEAAARVAADPIAAANRLEHFPERGRPASNGRRELASVPPYVIRYRVDGDTVIITAIKHGRQEG